MSARELAVEVGAEALYNHLRPNRDEPWSPPQHVAEAAAVLDAAHQVGHIYWADEPFEQVGWLDAESGTFYKTDAPWRVPVFRRVGEGTE